MKLRTFLAALLLSTPLANAGDILHITLTCFEEGVSQDDAIALAIQSGGSFSHNAGLVKKASDSTSITFPVVKATPVMKRGELVATVYSAKCGGHTMRLRTEDGRGVNSSFFHAVLYLNGEEHDMVCSKTESDFAE